MRVMVLIKATEESEAGVMPSQELPDDFGDSLNPELREQDARLRERSEANR